MSATETQKIGFFFSERQASEARERASPRCARVVPVSAPTAMVGASVMADPRVEHAVQQVDEQVDEQVHDDQDGHGADDGHAVAGADARVDVAADALDVEDALGDDRTTEQRAEVDSR